MNVSVQFPIGVRFRGNGFGCGDERQQAGDMFRGHALWLFVFRWRFRVRCSESYHGPVCEWCTTGTGRKYVWEQPVVDRLRHVRRSIRYADPPPHTVAILRCGGPEN